MSRYTGSLVCSYATCPGDEICEFTA